MRGDLYQVVLISLGIFVAGLFGIFVYREVYPEYRVYQKDYIALENFRSTYTGTPPPPFKEGVKQVVIENKNKGPAKIDRCTSCHVALEFEHFSPTIISKDLNGNIVYDQNGVPEKVENPNYVWKKLDEKILQLEKNGDLSLANKYRDLKKARIGEHTYDVTKALQMHPLIGKELRPFEFHPIDSYGCTTCHSGNGRALTTQKAHGPVFDGQYEEEFMGPEPKFLEEDPENDPLFAKVFNHKPSHELLFQTTPLLVGGLIEAKCVQCHQTKADVFQTAYDIANMTIKRRKERFETILSSYNQELLTLLSLLEIKRSIDTKGYLETLKDLEEKKENFELTFDAQKAYAAQAQFLRKNKQTPQNAIETINQTILNLVGSKSLVTSLEEKSPNSLEELKLFVDNNLKNSEATGSLFAKVQAVNDEKNFIKQVKETDQTLQGTLNDQDTLPAFTTDIDLLTKTYQEGQDLYISQACYTCHRITGFSRGGVGPELTEEGNKYPWFIKESITWPQADLKTSTMPNFRLDHEEQEALMTFLLAQVGKREFESDVQHKVSVQEWESGKKMAWEQEPAPGKIHDLEYGMEVFATQGCASCHRLKGYESTVGFSIEKSSDNDEEVLKEKKWFQSLFPEEIIGSEIVATIENHQDEILSKITENVKERSILDKIEEKYPGTIESFYPNFKFAVRAKDTEFKDSPEKKKVWQNLVWNTLMVYVQEYGLGRLIGPRPNWSGVYRSDKWLMEHFKNPSSHAAKSIMPVFPFTTNKFYALTYMLDTLGIKNKNALRRLWKSEGFNPQEAYNTLCSQCHGEYLQGNGPVSEWIYPIPKSLRNADFLRNLTKEKALESILHGVKGGPMAPWGEVGKDKLLIDETPVLTEDEASQIVDWIYSSLPGGQVIRSKQDVPKWKYTPEDVIQELKKESESLIEKKAPPLSFLPKGDQFYASLNPKVYVNNDISEYFDIKKHPVGKTEEEGYFIKKRFYTPQNLQAGEELFVLNCSSCHGREADGSGDRAVAMIDAKPRMLTNLDWLDTRDDLRLLRSIKYGVPGTSMIAWGDQTSSLQRMQLVMYIRKLSEEASLRDELYTKLYKAYSEPELAVERMRSTKAPQLIETQKQLEESKRKLRELNLNAKNGTALADQAASVYKEKLLLEQKLTQIQQKEEKLNTLVNEIKKSKNLMTDLGTGIIAQRAHGVNLKSFYSLVNLEAKQYEIKQDGTLVLKELPIEAISPIKQEILNQIDESIHLLEVKVSSERGRISSPEAIESIKNLKIQIKALKDLKNKVTYTVSELKRSSETQKKIFNEFLS